MITLEIGMLFANMDAFREVFRDYVIQVGFKIVRDKKEITRITTWCNARGCDLYLHVSCNADKVAFVIKVYEWKHTC